MAGEGSAGGGGAGEAGLASCLLDPREVAVLLQKLQETEKTLDALVSELSSEVHAGDASAKFRLGTALSLLLRDNLLSAGPRLAALYVLATLYREHPGGLNPFLPFFIEPLEATSPVSTAERRFTCDLLLSPPSSLRVGGKTSAETLAEYSGRRRALQVPDLDTLWRAFRDKVPTVPRLLDVELRPVVLDPKGPSCEARRRYLVSTSADALPLSLPAPQIEPGALTSLASRRLLPPHVLASPLPHLDKAQTAASLHARLDALAAAPSPHQPPLLPQTLAQSVPSFARNNARTEEADGKGGKTGKGGSLGEKSEKSGEKREKRDSGTARGGATGGGGGRGGGRGEGGGGREKVPVSSSSTPVSISEPSLWAGAGTLRGFRPPFPRPTPPLLEFLADEIPLPLASLPFPLLWEGRDGVSEGAVREAAALLQKGLTGPLGSAEAHSLTAALEANPKLAPAAGLSPATLPALVEHNHAIAVLCLQQLKAAQSPKLGEYLSALVSMDLSLRTMEVVNQLTNTSHLPPEFVHMYISNCIATCEAVEDKYHKHRLVRLVCVFLGSLIRSRRVRIKELFVEIQAFCVEFSRIKEAQVLYTLLRSVQEEAEGKEEE